MADYYPKYVPDDGPLGAKILLVGEAPGEHEHEIGKPFVGESGQKLIECLNRSGINRDEVRLANLCHYRPYGNKFELLLNTDILLEGLRELYGYIATYKPTVIGALGAWPLAFLTGKKGIKKWRGSILTYINDESIKVIPTVHPAAVLRDRSLFPTFDIDIQRIVSDSAYPDRKLPVRRFIIDPRGLDCEEWVQRLCEAEFVGTDIETVKNSTKILCCGFAPSPEIAVCFVPSHPEGLRAIQQVLSCPSVSKIFQFGTFDTIQLAALNGYEIRDAKANQLDRPYYWDTLVAQHTLAPELPRSLEYLTSVYTREPYYKTVGRGTIPDDEKGWSEKVEKQSLYEYNCRDCCCTIEIALQQMAELEQENEATREIFNFGMQMIEVANHISNSGMLVDDIRRATLERFLLEKWSTKQFALDRLVGKPCNVRSPLLKKILYEQLGLPQRFKDKRLTTDEDAIVSLITFCKDKVQSLKRADAILDWQVKLVICQTILEIRGIRVVLSNYIRTHTKKKIPRAREDNRIHSTYKDCGTETGRWSAMKYVDGTGFNSQTLPRDPWELDESVLTNTTDVAKFDQEAHQQKLIEQLNDEADDDDETEDEEAA